MLQAVDINVGNYKFPGEFLPKFVKFWKQVFILHRSYRINRDMTVAIGRRLGGILAKITLLESQALIVPTAMIDALIVYLYL